MKKLLLIITFVFIMPVSLLADDWRPLYESVDADLQKRLEDRLNLNPEWARLISRKKMAVGLVDMSQETARFARVNGNQMMYAASLPKIAILLAAYASFEDGSLPETQQHHKDLADMIRVSSNSAATRLIDAIGLPKIQSVLKDPQNGLYDEKRGGGLWVGKRFASSGKRIGDPMHNISHGATATQVCRFFYLLSAERLVSPERSRMMLNDLVDPRLHHKFVSQIDERAPDAKMYRKSGTWKQWHADAIMVKGTRWRDYILVALVESTNGETIIRQLLPAMEELIVPPEYAEGVDDLP